MNTKTIATVGIIAALYAAITILFAPLAYGPLQFRLSEILKPLALHGRKYVLALTIGLFAANLFSPFLGVLELILMPAACLIGGEITYRLRRWPVAALTLYAGIISAGVATMLHVVVGLPWLPTWGLVFIPELILMQVGRPICDRVLRRVQNG